MGTSARRFQLTRRSPLGDPRYDLWIAFPDLRRARRTKQRRAECAIPMGGHSDGRSVAESAARPVGTGARVGGNVNSGHRTYVRTTKASFQDAKTLFANAIAILEGLPAVRAARR
jgi:hypothetical protein